MVGKIQKFKDMEDLHGYDMTPEVKLGEHGKGPGKPGIALKGIDFILFLIDQKIYSQYTSVPQSIQIFPYEAGLPYGLILNMR